jgi:hypothetical protein
LITTAIEIAIKYLASMQQQPADPANNADDDIASIQNYIKSLLKDKYARDRD